MSKEYVSSGGVKMKIEEMNTAYLKNAMAKKMEALFESKNKTDFSKRLEEVNDLKEEYHKRLNKFYDTLGE